MEAASASQNLHPPCLQEIGSVEGNPFYCLCCLRTMCVCKALCAQTAAEQMMTMMTMMATYYCVLHLSIGIDQPIDVKLVHAGWCGRFGPRLSHPCHQCHHPYDDYRKLTLSSSSSQASATVKWQLMCMDTACVELGAVF